MKLTLNTAYIFSGVTYGPGEAEVPPEVADALKARGFLAATPEDSPVAPPAPPADADPALFVAEVGVELAAALRARGYASLDELRAADDDALLSVQGIGPARLKQLREALS